MSGYGTVADPESQEESAIKQAVAGKAIIETKSDDFSKEVDVTKPKKNRKRKTLGSDLSAFWSEFMVPNKFTALQNSLLIACPLGAVAYYLNWGSTAVFWLNFTALLPLAGLLGEVTEDVAANVKSEVIGGLLNCTFGNVVEVILSVAALQHGMINVVQGMLVGSILSNLLLVLGCSLVAGGMKHHTQEFKPTTVTVNIGMLLLCCLAMSIPTVYDSVTVSAAEGALDSNDLMTEKDLWMSRCSSIILFVMYMQFLWFQLYTHSEMFADEESSSEEEDEEEEGQQTETMALAGSAKPAGEAPGCMPDNPKAHMTFVSGFCALALVAALVSMNSELLVGVVEEVTKDTWMTEVFVGVVLLPIVGNAAEHLTAVTAAYKNKINLSLGIAIGSATQMAGFVTPLMVLIGWGMHQPMALDFHPFALCTLMVSVLVVANIMKDGTSTWLQGALLVSAYICVAIGFAMISPRTARSSDAPAFLLAQQAMVVN